jgi:hypothetical protein
MRSFGELLLSPFFFLLHLFLFAFMCGYIFLAARLRFHDYATSFGGSPEAFGVGGLTARLLDCRKPGA